MIVSGCWKFVFICVNF